MTSRSAEILPPGVFVHINKSVVYRHRHLIIEHKKPQQIVIRSVFFITHRRHSIGILFFFIRHCPGDTIKSRIITLGFALEANFSEK